MFSTKKVVALSGATLVVASLFFMFCGGEGSPEYCSDGNPYNSHNQFCGDDGMAYDKCNGQTYDPTTQFCGNRTVLDRCAGGEFIPTTQFCDNNVVYSLCAGQSFDPSLAGCYFDVITPRCGRNFYDDYREFCRNNRIYELCNGQEFDPSVGCGGEIVLPMCGEMTFDPDGADSERFCFNNTLHQKCGGSEFDPTIYFCSGNALYERCNGQTYTPPNNPCATHTLTVNAGTGGTVEPSGSVTRNTGARVTVRATANTGYTFSSWTGAPQGISPTSAVITFNINADVTLTANFREVQGQTTRTLTVNRNPTAGGTVTVNGATATTTTSNHADGAEVEVCASANDGYTFTGWQGASTETSGCVTIIMNTNQTLTARFQSEGGNQVSPLNAPQNLTVTNTATNSVSLRWSRVRGLDVIVNGYNIYRSMDSLGTYDFVAATNGATDTSYTNADLSPNTTYYYRVAAFNDDVESEMSDWASATTREEIVLQHNEITDPRDNKVYEIVAIGSQVWLARNLDNRGLREYEDGFWCYDDLSANCDIYGALYNWEVAMDGCSGLGDGWRLPDTSDWNVLENAVRGRSSAARHLKAQSGWVNCGPVGSDNPNVCEDTYGFSALPGGRRWSNGNFAGVNFDGSWWATTERDAINARYRHISNINESVSLSWEVKASGFSVRCVRDVD